MTTILGPVPCGACRRPIGWDGKQWNDAADGQPHRVPCKCDCACERAVCRVPSSMMCFPCRAGQHASSE